MIRFAFSEEGNMINEMDVDTFQKEAERTLRNDLPYECVCSNMAMGLAGESGEVIDLLKKHVWQGKELDINDLIEEIGDVLWYVANLCNVNNISMKECMKSNVEKLKVRYPQGFSIKDANERKDKVN